MSQTLRMFSSAVLLLLIMSQTVSVAVHNKMHQRIPEALDSYAEAISIVISHANFNLNGYTGSRNVYDTLIANGFDWDHHENPIVLNQAIHKAREVSQAGREHVLCSVGDIGFIDYVRMAFTLFGYNIGSFFFLYFLILFIQVAVFFIEFRKNDLAVAGLVLFLLGHYIVVNGVYGAGYNLWTIHNNRFLSVLGILPIAHLCLLALYRKSIRLGTFLGAFVQTLIFVFILRCRNSALWMLGPLLFLSGAALFGWCIKRRNDLKLWPVLMALAVVFLSVFIKPYILDPEYYGEKNVGGSHTFWFPVYVGLAIDPAIREIYGPRPDTGLNPQEYFQVVCGQAHPEDTVRKAQARKWLCGRPDIAKPALMALDKWRNWRLDYTQIDQDGHRAVLKWLRANGKTEEYLYTFGPKDKVGYPRWFGQCDSKEKDLQYEAFNKDLRLYDSRKDFKWREMDRIMGLVVKDAFVHYPFRVLKVVFITKPFFFLVYYFMYFVKAISLWAVLLILMTYGYLLFYMKASTAVDMRKLLVFLCILFAFSMIVTLAAYPAPHTISDQALLLTMCILGFVLNKILMCKGINSTRN